LEAEPVSLFTMDLANLTYRDIEEFCTQDLPENMRLDYKRQLSTSDQQKQVAKIVSSFANTQGGVALYGVGTKPKSKLPDWPAEGMPADADFENRVTRWCIEHVAPPVTPFIGYVQHPENSARAFAVVRTEMSWITPHTVDGGTRFYVRRADNSDPVDATFSEIELMRNRRQLAVDVERAHVNDLLVRIKPAVKQPLLRTLIVTPRFSSDTAIPWSRLHEIAYKFTEVGVKEELVGRVRPYSHGVIWSEDPQWTFALTARGAFGCAFTHGADAAEPRTIAVESILSWALMAVRGSSILSKEAGYWGDYVATARALSYGDLPVVDTRIQAGRPLAKCVDMNITTEIAWNALEAQASPCEVASRFGRRLLWAFGVNEARWKDESLMEILRGYAG
jgi:hypothetical protein